MTPEEAIEYLQDDINGLKEQKYGNMGEIAAEVFREINGDERIKVLNAAIEALKEVQQYREIGTVEECREAKEKQISKKPEIYTATIQTMSASINRDVYLCPVCGEFICNIEDELPNYCSYCGQAINDENLEGMEDGKTESN